MSITRSTRRPAHAAVRIAAYRKAVKIQQPQWIKAARARVKSADEAEALLLREFRTYRRIGGDPYDLLAALRDGMTLDDFLALAWPPPRYVRVRKQWKLDEPEHVRVLRAEWQRNGERGERVTDLPARKRTAFRLAQRYAENVKAQDPAFLAEIRLGGPDAWIDRSFRRFNRIGGDGRELIHAIWHGLTLKQFLAAPDAQVPYEFLRRIRKPQRKGGAK